MAEREPTVGDVYDDSVPRIANLRHAWDLERVQRPDLYGPPPKAVWDRLKRHRRAVGVEQHGDDRGSDG